MYWSTDFSSLFRSPCIGPRVPCKGSLIQQVEVLPRQRSSRPGSYPSNRGGNEAVEAWETKGGERPSARWQAVIRVNTETAPKDTMRRPTLRGLGEGWYGSNDRTTVSIRFAGVVGDSMSSRINEQHGKPAWVATSARPPGASGAWPQAGGGGARSTVEAG